MITGVITSPGFAILPHPSQQLLLSTIISRHRSFSQAPRSEGQHWYRTQSSHNPEFLFSKHKIHDPKSLVLFYLKLSRTSPALPLHSKIPRIYQHSEVEMPNSAVSSSESSSVAIDSHESENSGSSPSFCKRLEFPGAICRFPSSDPTSSQKCES